VPYTPAYVVAEGSEPEILLLKDLTYENGLPLGRKEIEMIEYARAKRDMESNLPPFTDEASLMLRKKMMEQQEMREFQLREEEVDSKREDKLTTLERALADREESNEFLTSQRLETVRLARMEEREKVLQKIRNKRIKALRRLAHQRNISDPVLSDGTGRDIINDYFDRGSRVYAPVRRDGQETAAAPQKYDVASRTLPLDNLSNILSLEYTIPKRLLDDEGNDNSGNVLMARSAPLRKANPAGGGGRAAESRLTSAAQRAIRFTKRDVEEMHQILMRKRSEGGEAPPSADNRDGSGRGGSAQGQGRGGKQSTILTALLAKKPKGRPPTPDFTSDRVLAPAPVQMAEEDGEELPPPPEDLTNYELKNDKEYQASVVLLQRLIRGRAVQNIMFEGKYRRRELIDELKAADEEIAAWEEPSASEIAMRQQAVEDFNIRGSTVDAMAGSVAANVFNTLAQVGVIVICHMPYANMPICHCHRIA
jgi:hypothetical protein